MRTEIEIINAMLADIKAMTQSINERTRRETELCEQWAQMLDEATAEYADIF